MFLYAPERAEKYLSRTKVGALARVREDPGPMVCERWMPASTPVALSGPSLSPATLANSADIGRRGATTFSRGRAHHLAHDFPPLP
jgi:hypothetical protein